MNPKQHVELVFNTNSTVKLTFRPSRKKLLKYFLNQI